MIVNYHCRDDYGSEVFLWNPDLISRTIKNCQKIELSKVIGSSNAGIVTCDIKT